jgi:hypothetical protein
MFHPVQTDFCIRIACFGAGKMLSGGGVSGPRTTVSGGWPDNERMKGAAVDGNAFNYGD